MTKVKLLATWFGCGLSPIAPGTVGTIGAIPLYWLMSRLPIDSYMLLTFAFIFFSIFICELYERQTQKHDLGEIVIDEVAGFLVAMTWIPFNWKYLIIGFVIFRILDAVKPFPINRVDQRVKGGVGVVADDLVAGLITNVILQIILDAQLLSM